jgi:hypothetical protein
MRKILFCLYSGLFVMLFVLENFYCDDSKQKSTRKLINVKGKRVKTPKLTRYYAFKHTFKCVI